MRTLAMIFLGAVLAACGDDDGGESCGVTDHNVSGAKLTVDGVTFSYGGFIWGQNNDCGPSSVTIRGGQTTPQDDRFGIGLCVPDPEAVGASPVSLTSGALVELVGATASNGGCTYMPAVDAAPIGTVTFAGFCTTAGTVFTVTFDATVPGRKDCAGTAGGASLVLSGTALIEPQ